MLLKQRKSQMMNKQENFAFPFSIFGIADDAPYNEEKGKNTIVNRMEIQ